MRKLRTIGLILGLLLLAAATALSQKSTPEQRNSLIIVFNDGRQQTISTADARIDFKGAEMIVSRGGHSQSFALAEIAHMEFSTIAAGLGRGRFLGRWKAGDGQGRTFYITLDRKGEAHKSLGASHGTWMVVDGEARISWDDGWHDAIRKTGSKYEKIAFEPGKTFDDTPSNVTEAENTNPEPL